MTIASRGEPRPGERGQGTVELALLLPVWALLILAVVQVGLVARAEVLTVQAAREAARAAAVGEDPRASTRLPAGLTIVDQHDVGPFVQVRVRYRQPTDVALVGALVGDVVHDVTITMRRETPR